MHHISLLQKAGAGRVLRTIAASATAPLQAKVFARVVLRNVELHPAGEHTTSSQKSSSKVLQVVSPITWKVFCTSSKVQCMKVQRMVKSMSSIPSYLMKHCKNAAVSKVLMASWQQVGARLSRISDKWMPCCSRGKYQIYPLLNVTQNSIMESFGNCNCKGKKMSCVTLQLKFQKSFLFTFQSV